MAQTLSLDIDPAQVLGVGPDANLQEIRDAYRAKVKRHHPDHGGEDWAFKILVQSYELLSTARVARAAARPEPPRRPRAPAGPPPGPDLGPGPGVTPPPRPRPAAASSGESVREGVSEKADDPSRVVDVEKLSLKHQADQVWLVTEHASESRFLSCSLNVSWPSARCEMLASEVPDGDRIVEELRAACDEVAGATRATASDSAVVDGRFSGWLSYPAGEQAIDAFDRLRHRLHKAGLAVHQWSRDVIIPRPRR